MKKSIKDLCREYGALCEVPHEYREGRWREAEALLLRQLREAIESWEAARD